MYVSQSVSSLFSYSISQELPPFHGELVFDVHHILVVYDASTADIEGQHDGHKESVIGHDRYRPQDNEGTQEDGVTAVFKELLLFSRFVVHRITEAIVGIVQLCGNKGVSHQ